MSAKTDELIRAKVRILHATRCITQAQLARLFNITQQQVSNYCRGKTQHRKKSSS